MSLRHRDILYLWTIWIIFVSWVATDPALVQPEFENLKKIHKCKQCISAHIGVPVKVKCSIDNSTNQDLNIFKNGKLLYEADSTQGNGKLSASYKFTPSKDDIHTYFTCEVPNNSKTLATNASIYLIIPPKSVVVNIPDVIKEGERQTITCMTYGGRPPYMPDFIFNSTTRNETKNKTQEIDGDMFNVTATIQLVFTRHDNMAPIQCVVKKNHFNVSSEEKTVHVLFPPNSANFTEVSKDNKNNGDTRLVLRLDVDASNPRSDFKWIGVESMDATSEEKYSNDSKTKGNVLNVTLIMNLTRADNRRQIEVQISNTAFRDNDIISKYELDILYSPIVSIDGSNEGNITVYYGNDVTLTCNVDGNPSPTRVTWYQGSTALKETKKTLTLYNITNLGDLNYTCQAENTKGTGSDSVTLTVMDTSEKPVNDPVTSFTDTSEKPVNDPVTSFTDTSEKPVISENNTVTSFPIVQVVGGISALLVAIAAVSLFCLCRKKQKQKQEERNHGIKIEERRQSAEQNINEPLYQTVTKRNETTMKAEGNPNDQHPADKEKTQSASKPSGTRNEDGLLYVDLDFPNVKPSTSRPVIVEDDTVQYITVDFTKVGH